MDITVTGETGEGDGIDSNGWLVIDGGRVTASACATSGDAPENMTPPEGGFPQMSGSQTQRPVGEVSGDFTFAKGYNTFSITGTTN